MATASEIKMTARQFLHLGEDPPGVRLELVEGDIAVSLTPNPLHQHAVLALARILGQYVEDHQLGEVLSDIDTFFGPHDVRRRDLFYFAAARTHMIGETAIEGPPDLCIEVLSPGSIQIDRVDKFKQYARSGVAHYWIIDPMEQTIEAFSLRRAKYVRVGSGQRSETIAEPV